MTKMTSGKMKIVGIAVVFLSVVVTCIISYAGAEKTGGTYAIVSDQLTAAGSKTTGGPYVMIYSACQPVGHGDLNGGPYNMEGGYISGILPEFDITKTLSLVEIPVGYTGTVADRAPGTRLTYTVSVTNNGDQGFNVLVEDPTPANLTYSTTSIFLTVSGITTAMTDGMDGDQCAYMATDTVHCLIESFGAGATAAVVFKAIIN